MSAFNKLVSVDRVNLIIGDLTSGCTLALAPLANEQKILLVSPTASSPKLSNVGPYFLRVWPSDNYDGVVAATYCAQALRRSKAMVLHLKDDYSLGLSDVFAREFARLGGQVTMRDSYEEDRTDFRTVLLRIAADEEAVVYIPGHPRGLASILRQARELGLKNTFFANVAAEDREFPVLAGNAADGLYFTSPAFGNDSGSASRAFIDQYRVRFQQEADVHAAKGYDAALAILSALASGVRNPAAVRSQVLSTGHFDGASGPLEFDDNGDVRSSTAVKQYQGGAVKRIAVVPPNS